MALCMRYNRLGCKELRLLAPNLRKFTSLTVLDLSWNEINLVDSPDSADVLGGTLAQLHLLTRLNLSMNRLKNQLRSVLSKMSASLTHLHLGHCGLDVNDLAFLSESQHVSTLKVLDISYNNIGKHFEQFLLLLSALERHLSVLITKNCSFQQSHLTHLFQKASKKLCLLRFWNISHNCAPTTVNGFMQDVKVLAEVSSLETLVLSFPKELGSLADSMAENPPLKSRDEFRERLRGMLSNLLIKPHLDVVLVGNSETQYHE